MKKSLLALVVLIAAWFGLKDLAYRTFLSSGAPNQPAALAYDMNEHWAGLPESLPPGAWERPWGIDAFVVLPPANLARAHGLIAADDEIAVEIALQDLISMSDAIPGLTPVYAPFYRTPSPASRGDVLDAANSLASTDLVSAFEHYLAEHNRIRGVILIVAEPAEAYIGPLLERMQAEDLQNRFAGLVSFGSSKDNKDAHSLSCADILEGVCHQRVEVAHKSDLVGFLFPRVDASPAMASVSDAPGVAEAIKVQVETVSTWLDETQPKPAEPFFDVQIIEEVPILRPGEREAPVE